MICPKCNSLIDDNTKFCPECGSAITQNDNFNNFFAQDSNINSNYQNPQTPPQNNFDAAYPNSNYYNPQYAPVDPGESSATTSQICGILSLFLGPILSIISLVFASKYKKVGNGQNAGKVKVGKVCSWISIVGTLLSLILMLVSFFAIFSSTSDLIGDIKQPYEDSYYSDDDFEYNNDAFTNDELNDDYGYDTNDEYQTDDVVLYNKDISKNGEVVYNENNIEITLTEFTISHNDEFNSLNFDASYLIEMPDNYTLDLDGAYVNNEKTTPASSYRFGNQGGLSFSNSDIDSIDEIDSVFCHYIVEDSETGEELFDLNIKLY